MGHWVASEVRTGVAIIALIKLLGDITTTREVGGTFLREPTTSGRPAPDGVGLPTPASKEIPSDLQILSKQP